MRATTVSRYQALVLFAAALVCAQDQQQQAPSPTSPPFPLDSNGEAHFNIPVVVKLADLNVAAAAAAAAAVQPRHEDGVEHATANTAEDVESSQAVPALDSSHAKIPLAAPAYVDPAFEVTHQGASRDGGLKARDYNPGAAASPATHTVLLVETTGTAINTISEPCTDTDDQSTTATPSGSNSTSPVIADETGKPPLPLNHTGFPMRNGSEASLPCNSTGGGGGQGVKPLATGLGGGAAKPSGGAVGTGMPMNPANMGAVPTKLHTGEAAGVRVAGMAAGMVVAALVALNA